MNCPVHHANHLQNYRNKINPELKLEKCIEPAHLEIGETIYNHSP